MKRSDETAIARPVRVVLDGIFPTHSPNKGTINHLLILDKIGLFYTHELSNDEISRPVSRVDRLVLPESYANYQCLKLQDIVGCQCMRDPISPPPPLCYDDDDDAVIPVSKTAYFCVYSYPIRKVFGVGFRRQRLSITFTVDIHDTFVNNLKVAKQWCDAIQCLLHGDVETTTQIANESFEQDIPCRVCQSGRKLLILVNPQSGPGKALQIFQERVLPVLAEAGISFDLVITGRPKEAQDRVKTSDLSEWHGIVIVSGDGLVFEVINGLMARSDWSTAIQIPIGIIPGGSGNGLAKAISHASREPSKTNEQLLAAFNVARGRAVPMDVIRLTTTIETMYSFLSVGWGIIADIDIESERLRSLGSSRFTIWALARIIDLRVYRGRLSYIPAFDVKASSSRSGTPNNDSSNTTSSINNDVHRHNSSSNIPASSDMSSNECQFKRDHSQSAYASTPSSSLPPLDEPVPESWIQGGEEEFVLVYVVFQSHISSNAYIAPDASPDDGLMWMMVIRKGVTRSQLISFLLAIESGTHTALPFVEMTPVHAFRLEPITEGGHLTVDGEVIQYGPVQAEVLRGVARIMTH